MDCCLARFVLLEAVVKHVVLGRTRPAQDVRWRLRTQAEIVLCQLRGYMPCQLWHEINLVMLGPRQTLLGQPPHAQTDVFKIGAFHHRAHDAFVTLIELGQVSSTSLTSL